MKKYARAGNRIDIIYITSIPFNQRDYNRFGCAIMEKRFGSMMVWDLSMLVNKASYRSWLQLDSIGEAPYLSQVRSYKDLKSKIKRCKNRTFFISTNSVGVFWGKEGIAICKAVRKGGHLWGTIYIKSLPWHYAEDRGEDIIKARAKIEGSVQQIKSKSLFTTSALKPSKEIKYSQLPQIGPQKLIHKFCKALSWRISFLYYNLFLTSVKSLLKKYFGFKFPKISFPDFIIVGTAHSLDSHVYSISDDHTEIIFTHADNYDRYLELQRGEYQRVETGTLPSDYCVFLDEYFPFHPEWSIMPPSKKISPDSYYSKLHSFLKRIEAMAACECLIAVHPRANYEDKKECLYGRKVFYDQTIELVKYCRFVLSHSSTSIAYAVLFKKPFISFYFYDNINCDEVKKAYEMNIPPLGKKAILAEGDYRIDLQKELKVDQSAYEWYRENIIKKSGTPQKYIFEIFADWIDTKIKAKTV